MIFKAARIFLAIGPALILSTFAPASCAQPAQRDASHLRFESGFTGPAPSTWPPDAPPVRFYFADGTTAPSCGLLVTAKNWSFRCSSLMRERISRNAPACPRPWC